MATVGYQSGVTGEEMSDLVCCEQRSDLSRQFSAGALEAVADRSDSSL